MAETLNETAGQPGAGINLRRWLGAFLDGLQAGLAPMLAKEMRSRTRGLRSPVLLTIYLLILTGVVTGLLWLIRDKARLVGPEIGLNLFSFFTLVMVMLLAFIAPAMAAGAISGERERRTYDLLMVTRASAAGIVLGKWLASVMYLLWLVLAALPVFAVIYLYGGMPARQVGLTLIIILATGMSYGALGLALSAVLKRSQAATIIAIILVFVLLFGTLVGAVLQLDYLHSRAAAAGESYPQPGIPWYVFHSPLPALTSVLPGGDGRTAAGFRMPLLGDLLRDFWQQFNLVPAAGMTVKMGYSYASGYIGMGPGLAPEPPGGLAALPFWARFLINQAALLFLCLLVATVAVMPVKPWQISRRR
ncbi:MAG: hypothetical protein PWQ18_280 [Clostridia bacterium]|nr:hypothetical protein [Clostridia bacterium]